MKQFGSRSLLVALILTTALFGMFPQAVAGQYDFSLQKCIDRALEKNIGIISAENSYRSAKYDLWEAWGYALPKASISANYSYYKTYGKQYNSQYGYYYEVPGSKEYSTSVNLSMPLFDGGYTWFNIKYAKENKTTYNNSLQSTILSTMLEVKRAYYSLISAIMLKKVQADALARSKKQLEITTSRYELGSASLSEKLKQEVNVANDSLRLLERQNDISNAEFNLNLWMNRDVVLPIVPTDDLKEVGFTSNLEECLDAAFKNNPGLKASKANVGAAKATVRMAKSTWVPNVSARLGWGWSTTEKDNWLKFKHDNRSYYFGISVGYSLFDRFTKKTNYSKAKLSVRSYKEQYDADQNILTQSVRKAYLDIQKSKLQYNTALLAEKSAEEDLKLQQEKYRLGASSILELLDAQYSLTNAQYSKVLALYNLNIAVAEMVEAMGQI